MSKKSILLEKPNIWKPTVLVLFVVVSLIGYSAITGRNTQISNLQAEVENLKAQNEFLNNELFIRDLIRDRTPPPPIIDSIELTRGWQVDEAWSFVGNNASQTTYIHYSLVPQIAVVNDYGYSMLPNEGLIYRFIENKYDFLKWYRSYDGNYYLPDKWMKIKVWRFDTSKQASTYYISTFGGLPWENAYHLWTYYQWRIGIENTGQEQYSQHYYIYGILWNNFVVSLEAEDFVVSLYNQPLTELELVEYYTKFIVLKLKFLAGDLSLSTFQAEYGAFSGLRDYIGGLNNE